MKSLRIRAERGGPGCTPGEYATERYTFSVRTWKAVFFGFFLLACFFFFFFFFVFFCCFFLCVFFFVCLLLFFFFFWGGGGGIGDAIISCTDSICFYG